MSNQDNSNIAIFSNNLPFNPKRGSCMYLEPQSGANQVNNYINNNYSSVVELFGENRPFVYLPDIVRHQDAILHYNYPWPDASRAERTNVHVQNMYREILSYCTSGIELFQTPVIMRYNYWRDYCFYFSVFPLYYEDDNQFVNQIKEIVSAPVLSSGVRASSITDVTSRRRIEQDVDLEWVYAQANDINERIKQLQMSGVSSYVIRKLIVLPEPKLSRLRITKDFQIILTDYDNLQISMPTLSKVVFFFFLRHPEGVRLKRLVEHKDELLQIYYRLSNREDIDKLEKSIDDLVDPTNNSINEKCSRIRAAFVNNFTDDLAKHYYIIGDSSTPKYINLDRSLVEDESGTLKE